MLESLKKHPSSPAPPDEAGEEESLLPLCTGEGRSCNQQAGRPPLPALRRQENMLPYAVQNRSGLKGFHLSQFANLSHM